MKKKRLRIIAENLESLETCRRQMRRDWISMRKRLEEEISNKWDIVKDESERNSLQNLIERVLETDARMMYFDRKMLSLQQEISDYLCTLERTLIIRSQ